MRNREQLNDTADNSLEYDPNRLRKLAQLRSLGIDPYPDHYDKTHSCREVQQGVEALLNQNVAIAGRLMTKRVMGRIIFAHLQDQSGEVQIVLQEDRVGRETMGIFEQLFDLGDIVGVRGLPFVTQRGEPTVRAEETTMLAKALLPLPDKYHGVTDPELIIRQRYLELITSPQAKARFLAKSAVLKSVRRSLGEADFWEVETSVLQKEPSGANAASFTTHHQALDATFHLRVAPELELKQYIVAGFERIYEIARVFRNEGLDPSHLQEFSLLEYYAAWWNAAKNRQFTQQLLQAAMEAVSGGNRVLKIDEKKIHFAGDWPVRDYSTVLAEYSGIDINEHNSVDSLTEEIRRKGIMIDNLDGYGRGAVVDKMWKATARPHLVQPQFITCYPYELSPLARPNDQNPSFVDQFQVLIDGWEIAKGYSELVDPLIQQWTLEQQARLRAAGDNEAMPLNRDYLRAMAHGMPPNSGVGIGIDRLVALLTNTRNVRDVIFTPQVRPLE